MSAGGVAVGEENVRLRADVCSSLAYCPASLRKVRSKGGS